MSSSQHTMSEPSFPTQAELRALVGDLERNALAKQMFFDTLRFRAVVDLDGVIVALNDYARQQRGADVELLLNRPMWDDPLFAGDPLWEGRLRSRFAEALASPTGTIEYEDRVDPPDGPVLLVRVRVATIKNDLGLPIGFLVDSTDVGREYRSRELVREQQRLLHVVFERTFQLIAILDADGRIIDVNDVVSRIQLSRDVAIGRTVMELAQAEGPERVAQWQERIDAMQTATEPRRYFDVLETEATGGRIATDVSMTPVRNEDGTLELILLEFRDQTERFEAEQRLRAQTQQIEAAAELAGLGSFVWEADTRQLRTDERFRRILSFDVADEPTGEALSSFLGRLHPDDRDRIRTSLEASMTPGGPPFNQQYRVLDQGPLGVEERWIACVARCEFDEHGAVARMLGAIQDVTTARRQDEARARLQKVEAIGTLVGAIAHDFNNVIGAILTYARVAEAEMAAGEQPTESIAEIARGARRAADILGRVMAFGREETPRRIRFDGAEIVQEAAALLRPTLAAGTEIALDLPEGLPPLDGDPTQIHQVFVNLLTNAAQVLAEQPDGRITVRAVVVDVDGTVSEGATVDPGRYLRFTVQDNGPGFAEGVAHRLFDPFFTTKASGKGTGLGLAAVQSIVRAHHGYVGATEPPAGGALFTVLLPVVADAVPGDAEPPAAPAPEVSAPSDRAAQAPNPERPAPPARRAGPIRALFVDDEPALVRLAGRAMPYRDIEVSGHVDAVEALEAFAASPNDFDVLVTDLSMPAMSGFELVDRIRAQRPDFPVVLTSGYMGPADERAAAERGIDAVLPKPCSIDALAAAVQRVAGR